MIKNRQDGTSSKWTKRLEILLITVALLTISNFGGEFLLYFVSAARRLFDRLVSSSESEL